MNTQDPWAKGAAVEARALKALKELSEMHPDVVTWFTTAITEFDVQGVDALVEVRLPPGSEKKRLVVPLQFKSSLDGVNSWIRRHPTLFHSGVPIFYFPDSMSARDVRRLIYRALDRVRRHGHYPGMYRFVFERMHSLSPKYQAYIARILEERAQRTGS